MCALVLAGTLGFDTLAAQCVLSLKNQHPHIKLILVLPCITQTKGLERKRHSDL